MKLHEIAWNCMKLHEIELPKIAKNYPKLPKIARNCLKFRNASRQIAPNIAAVSQRKQFFIFVGIQLLRKGQNLKLKITHIPWNWLKLHEIEFQKIATICKNFKITYNIQKLFEIEYAFLHML